MCRGWISIAQTLVLETEALLANDGVLHATIPVHTGDTSTARVYAVQGDVSGASSAEVLLDLSKAVDVRAGRDVSNFNLRVQHANASDRSRVQAGRDVSFADRLTRNDPDGIRVGGLGSLEVQAGETVLWCRYADLCEQPFAAMDFIALCDRYTAILLSDVPNLSAQKREGRIARGTEDGAQRVAAGDRELPQLSVHDDGVRRFIALVDECYDRKVPLYLEAQVPMEQLYTEGYLEFPFRRTLSRLQEMQLQRFKQA